MRMEAMVKARRFGRVLAIMGVLVVPLGSGAAQASSTRNVTADGWYQFSYNMHHWVNSLGADVWEIDASLDLVSDTCADVNLSHADLGVDAGAQCSVRLSGRLSHWAPGPGYTASVPQGEAPFWFSGSHVLSSGAGVDQFTLTSVFSGGDAFDISPWSFDVAGPPQTLWAGPSTAMGNASTHDGRSTPATALYHLEPTDWSCGSCSGDYYTFYATGRFTATIEFDDWTPE